MVAHLQNISASLTTHTNKTLCSYQIQKSCWTVSMLENIVSFGSDGWWLMMMAVYSFIKSSLLLMANNININAESIVCLLLTFIYVCVCILVIRMFWTPSSAPALLDSSSSACRVSPCFLEISSLPLPAFSALSPQRCTNPLLTCRFIMWLKLESKLFSKTRKRCLIWLICKSVQECFSSSKTELLLIPVDHQLLSHSFAHSWLIVL